MQYFLIIFSIFIGGFFSIQGSINARLEHYINHPIQAAFVNFFVGCIFLMLLIIIFRRKNTNQPEFKKIPKYLFCGGFIGATFVTTLVFLIPKMGVTAFLGAVIAGQMFIASVTEHYGFLNGKKHHISLLRIMGILLLIFGTFLIQTF